MSQSTYEAFLGHRVTVLYNDEKGITPVTGTLKTVDEETLGIETFHGITLIGRQAVIRVKLARLPARLDTPFLPSGGEPR